MPAQAQQTSAGFNIGIAGDTENGSERTKNDLKYEKSWS